MTTTEAKRHDLYNALTEFTGADRAETLMTYLPSQAGNDLATRSDLSALDERTDRLEIAMTTRFDAMNQRLDRVVLTNSAGLVAILAAIIAQTFL